MKIRPGYVFKNNKNKSYLFVLKIKELGHAQSLMDNNWSTQCRNDEKDTIIYGWDGNFFDKKSLKEINILYDELLEPDVLTICEALEKINN